MSVHRDRYDDGNGWGRHKPDSVIRPKTACDHLSPTDRSQRTRRSEVRLIPEAISKPRLESEAVNSFLLLCLAPHGVCPASRLAPGAVSSYLAFSPLSRNEPGRFVFCDTVRPPGLTSRCPLPLAGHPALWSSDFPHSDRVGTRLPDPCCFSLTAGLTVNELL